jgi:hypothetical protein
MNTLHREEVLQAERRHAAAEGHAKSLLSREAELSTQLTQVFFLLPEHQQLACLANTRVITMWGFRCRSINNSRALQTCVLL